MSIAVKIDLSKIEEKRIFPGKNGSRWLDLILIETPNNSYGNSHMAVQSVSKEEREAGIRGPILGNAKTLGGQAPQRSVNNRSNSGPSKELDPEDVPF